VLEVSGARGFRSGGCGVSRSRTATDEEEACDDHYHDHHGATIMMVESRRCDDLSTLIAIFERRLDEEVG
jgi:hypothetical protein